MRNYLSLLLMLCLLAAPALAQNHCFICNSQKGLRQVKVGTGTDYLCQECREKKSACDICRRQGAGTLQPDGTRICDSCACNRVITQEQLEDLYDGVQRFLRNDETGVLVNFDLQVKLADRDEFYTQLARGGRAIAAVGFYSPYNPERIFILKGREKLESSSTLVHEYTHAWQSRNCPSQDRALSEGFACYVQYRYLQSLGRRGMAQRLTTNSDPDYGASLKTLLAYERKVGVKGVVEYAKTARNLPKL